MNIEKNITMPHALKLAPIIAAIVLSACGGGGSGSETPAPPVAPEPVAPEPVAPEPVALVAGSATPVPYDPADQQPGCADGAALGAKLNPAGTGAVGVFARSTNGNLLLAEWGLCDGRSRIRVIDPAGNTIKTLAVGASRAIEDSKEALTTFLSPAAIAAGPSGDIYIADSDYFTGGLTGTTRTLPNRGPGIWKLDSHGNISVLAGVSLPMVRPGVDGVGAAASFNLIQTMCRGSDGLLYLNDYVGLRTVSPSGTVTTVTGPDYLPSVAGCGIDGSVLVRRWFHDPSDDDFYDPIAQKSIAKASVSALKMGVNFGPWLYFGPDHPSVLIPEGGPPYSGLAIVNLVDGSSETVARFGTSADLTATPPVIPAPIGPATAAGVATGGMSFDVLTGQGVFRFTRKP